MGALVQLSGTSYIALRIAQVIITSLSIHKNQACFGCAQKQTMAIGKQRKENKKKQKLTGMEKGSLSERSQHVTCRCLYS